MATIVRQRQAGVFRVETDHLRVAFLLGITSLIYINLVGTIKVVDVGLLLAIPFFLTRIIKVNRETFLLLFLLFLGFVNISLSPYFGFDLSNEAISTGVRMLAAVIMFAIVSKFSSRELNAFTTGVVTAGLLTALMSLIPHLIPGIPNILNTYESRYGTSLQGTLPDPNRFGLVMATCFCLYFWRLFNTERKTIPMAILFLFGLTVFLSGSRGAVIALAVATTLTATIMNRRQMRRLIVVYAVIAFMAVGILTLQETPQFAAFAAQSKFYTKTFSDAGRIEKTQVGFDLWTESPLLGLGFAGYKLYAFQGTSHNSYMEILVSFGIIGAIPYALLFISIIRGLYLTHHITSETHSTSYNYSRILLFTYLAVHMAGINIHYMVFAYGLLGVLANRASLIETAQEQTPQLLKIYHKQPGRSTALGHGVAGRIVAGG